ncbi:SCO5918 family protein [Streptomyces sp. NPDC006326]|uniref:SCO5918 family protein n=1 Tax=Streptomyces sp. NPDC006326 TaxID=3156752 RepID=UPI0033B246FC
MRCVIARFPFELTKSGVLETMKGVKPEKALGASVIVGRRTYPVKQVGQVVTRQDRRDFSAVEVTRAMTQLGFTCREQREDTVSTHHLRPLQQASAVLGVPVAVAAELVADLGRI